MKKNKNTKVIFLNTHSTLNTGDTGIVLAQIQYFRKHFPNLEISLTSRTPEIDQKFYNSMGIKVFSALIPSPSISVGGIQKIKYILKNLINLKAKINLIREIKESDLVISSGGGYFYTYRKILPGPMFFQNLLHVGLARLLNKPIIFFPQSFGPFNNSLSLKLIKKVLQSSNVIKVFVRENTSYELLLNILDTGYQKKVELCPDMAFYLNRELHQRYIDKQYLNLPKPILAITLREWCFPEVKSKQDKLAKREAYLDTLINISKIFINQFRGSVVVFPQVRGPGIIEDDRKITDEFKNRLKKLVINKNILFIKLDDIISPSKIINILSQTDIIIATRFHSAIFALMSGVPVISITYQPKSKGIMKLLELEHFCLNITDIQVKEILRLIKEITTHYSYNKRKIQNNVYNIRKEIETKLENTTKFLY